MSLWNKLSAVNCSGHTEKKGQFTYLSWAWAWAEFKKVVPEATYKLPVIETYPDGTAEVICEVTADGLTHAMWLPVLDFKNKPVVNPNAMDINKAKMRCLVKCLAMFGLGHYIYAGEDLPEEAVNQADLTAAQVINLCDSGDADGVKALLDALDKNAKNLVWSKLAAQYQTKIQGLYA